MMMQGGFNRFNPTMMRAAALRAPAPGMGGMQMPAGGFGMGQPTGAPPPPVAGSFSQAAQQAGIGQGLTPFGQAAQAAGIGGPNQASGGSLTPFGQAAQNAGIGGPNQAPGGNLTPFGQAAQNAGIGQPPPPNQNMPQMPMRPGGFPGMPSGPMPGPRGY